VVVSKAKVMEVFMESNPRKVGILVASLDPVVEHDFKCFIPRGISFHVGRLPQSLASRTASDDNLSHMCEMAPLVARQLAELDVEIILFCCTSASFYKGNNWHQELAWKIQDEVNVPALTTSTALLEALRGLSIKRLFMLTPYNDVVNDREEQFLVNNGFSVVSRASFFCEHSRDIDKIKPSEIIAKVKNHKETILDCDGLFVSCTALRAMETVCILEKELGKPVVTSNASIIWSCLGRLGIDSVSVPGGKLFSKKWQQFPA
jgi:maleate isomerase